MFTGMHARHARNTRTRSTGSYIGKGARRPGGVRLLAWLTMLTVVLGLAAPGLLGSAAAQTPPSPAPSATATGSISSQGGTATPTATAAPAESGPRVPLIVKFKAGAGAADIDATIKAAGGQSVRELPQIRSRVISVPEHARDQILAAYQKQSAVERAAAAVKLAKAGAPNDPGYAQQWALPKIGWDQAYGVVPVSGSARIAVLDTGVDAAHPDLAGRMAAGQSFTGGNPDSDPNGHGTALAGIAAAAVNNATGVAGVAYASGVSISSVQVLGADGTGWDADVVAGVLWAADSGASVLLMGFSSSVYSAALADALAYAWGKGAVLVAATGNDGSTATTYPAGMPNVIGVAATDQNDAVTAGSNTGSAAVAAPGASIYTTQAGGGYGTVGGTSAAAAHVAGLAALLRAGGKSNADASNQIRAAVDPLSSRPFGRINVAKALGAPVAPLPTATPVPATPTPGATATYVAGANVNSATISIHEPSTSGCGNPKTTFTSGSTACARAVVEITGGSTADYRLQWYEPGNVNGNPVRDVLIANKTAGTYTHDDTLTVTTVGTWTFLVCKTGNAGSCSSGNRVGTATFTVTGNTQPVAANLNVTTFEDTAKNITLSGSDADGNTLTFSITTGPSNGSLGSIGTVTCIANTPSTGTTCTANITYTPNANYNGSDSFTYKANDGTADSSPATVTITITPVNDAPTVAANNNAVTVSEGQTASNTGTYSDVDTGDNVTISASIGTITKTGSNNGTWSWSYTPPDGPATLTVTITATDNNGASASTSFTVKVNNVAPTATFNAPSEVNEGSPINLSLTGASDPSSVDTQAGFQYAFDCGDGNGYGTFSTTGSASCPTTDNGTRTVKGKIKDRDGGETEYTATVTIKNVAPTPAISGAPTSSPEGTAISLSGSATDPSSADTTAGFTFAWSVKKTHGSTTTNPFAMGSGASFSFTPDDDGTYEVTLTATDKDGGSGSTSVSITVTNVAPTAALTNNGPVYEGSPVTVSFSNQFDPSTADTTAGFHYAFSCTNVDLSGATYAGSGMSASTTCTFADNGSYQVKGRIIDKDGGYTEYSTTVQVNNVPPTITSLSVNVVSDSGTTPLIGPVPVGTTIQVTANFTDPGTWDTHTCTFAWDDGTSDTSVLAQNTGSGSCETTHTYKRAGVYTVRVTVTDDDDGSATAVFEYIVVYDPNGGFVTGGGWIDSPSGACKLTDACQGATGKANFGFVSRYQKGANVPTGETEFQFKAGNLNFKSSSYQWLVISGPKAQYKGYGTINGSGNYGFLLTAIDGQINGGGGTDKFRIKIWIINSNGTDSDVVYDNQVSCSNGTSDTADPCTVLGGGSIVIHTK